MSRGAIEAGGTHWNCAIGGGEGAELARVETFPTTTPAETIGRAVEFFAAEPDLEALGVGLFGPVEVRRGSPRWGTILTTPKPGWQGVDVAGALGEALRVPIALDTDVNAAALGEWRHGAAQGLETFVYVTVGTGIGGGVFANGRPVHGFLHPEVGHMLIPHDRGGDPFEGCCPFHGDCLEGLASGTAMRARWGRPAEELTDPEAWELEASYLALGLANVVMAVSAERIVLGGGVARAPGLIERVRLHLHETLAGYVPAPEIMPPALGPRSALVGALHLAHSC
ncbi:MAG TPA: ROK family protein [Solirubrobacterales bacterium]|nr:ROK family protein [Solirubrobacterales bacterium]